MMTGAVPRPAVPAYRGGAIAWLIGLGIVATAWQATLSLELIRPELLPPIGDVLGVAWDLVRRPSFLMHAGVTGAEVALAFLIAVPLGIALGIAIEESPYWSEVLKPIVFVIFSVPKTIFLPLFILAFGINFGQKVGFGVFSAVFIVLISTFSALESVKREHVQVARAYGATTRQIAGRVYFPSMAPVLLEAVRIAMIFNLTGVLLAEMYASRAGLGQLIANWGENFMLRELLAAILLISAAAIAFNEAVRWLETRFEHWRT